MKRLIYFALIIAFIFSFIFFSCELVNTPSNGSIKVSITSAIPGNTHLFVATVYNHGETSSPIDLNSVTITGGKASVVLNNNGSLFKGGKTYDIWCFIDMNNNFILGDSGDYITHQPTAITINGNISVNTDFVNYDLIL